MKASELIRILAELKAKHGDVPVYCFCNYLREVEKADFQDQCPLAPDNILIE